MTWTEILQITGVVVLYFFASRLTYFFIDDDLSFPKWYVAILWAPLLVMLLTSGLLLFVVWVLHTMLWKWPASLAKAILSKTRFWPYVEESPRTAFHAPSGVSYIDPNTNNVVRPEILTFPPITFQTRNGIQILSDPRQPIMEHRKDEPIISTPPTTPNPVETKERFDEL